MVGDGTHDGTSDSQPGVWCAACDNRSGAGDVCGVCGRALAGEAADRLRTIARRRWELDVAAVAMRREASALDLERHTLLQATSVAGSRRPSTRAASTPAGEWKPEVVSDVLVWLGATLLSLAALTFVAVAFTRLSPVGRTELMAASSLVPFTIAVFLRRRVPHTADAVFVLAVVFALVAWGTPRHIGPAEHVSGVAWWALGSAIGALLTGAAGRWLGFASARALAAIGVCVAGATSAHALGGSHAREASALAVVAMLTVVVAAGAHRVALWSGGPHRLLGAGAIGQLLIAGAFVSEVVSRDHRHDLVAVAAVGVLGAAPFVAWLLRRDFAWTPSGRSLALVVASGAPAGAAIVWLSGRLHGDALLCAVAIVGCAIAVAVFAVRDEIAAPVALVGGATVTAAAIGVTDPVLTVALRPLGWSSHAWRSGANLRLRDHLSPNGADVVLHHGMLPGLVMVVAALGAAVYATSRQRGASEASGGGVADFVAVASVLMGFAATYSIVASGLGAAAVAALSLSAVAVALGAAVWAERRAARYVPSFVVAALVSALPAVAAAIAVRSVAVGALVVVAVACGAVIATAGPSNLRLGSTAGLVAALLTLTGTVTATFEVSRATVGLAVSVAAALAIIAGSWLRRWPSEHVAVAAAAHIGVGVAIALCADAPASVAIAVTILAVAHALAAVRAAPYLPAAAATSVVSVWAWLGVAGVRLLEAYTLPAAVVMLLAGLAARRRERELSSWLVLGPGLLVAFAPTLALTIERASVERSLPLTACALVVVVIGAWARVQAPLVIGAATLVALGADLLGPVAARAPRWIALGLAGTALLWLGATAERRLRQARSWGHTFAGYS